MTAPYSISLLNDLHRHFPDLLYQPQRFQSVPDVLNYIISVANRNPYETARTQYEQHIQPVAPVVRPAARPNPPVRSNPRISILSNEDVISSSNEFYRLMHGTYPLPPRSNIPPAEDLVSNILRDMMGGNNPLEAFLQPVSSRMNADQIEQGTILTRSLQRQDDDCAICQDPIEQDQMMRIVRHCTHRFHQTCIDTWLNSHVTCPSCRHDIRQ
jgi:Ring finger domain